MEYPHVNVHLPPYRASTEALAERAISMVKHHAADPGFLRSQGYKRSLQKHGFTAHMRSAPSSSFMEFFITGECDTTLDDLAAGLYADTSHAHRTVQALLYKYDFLDGAVLQTGETRSVEDPFRWFGLKYARLSLHAVFQPRDTVYAELSGTNVDAVGTRTLYQVRHSVDIPDFPPYPNVVRFSYEMSWIFRPLATGRAGFTIVGHLNPMGNIPSWFFNKRTPQKHSINTATFSDLARLRRLLEASPAPIHRVRDGSTQKCFVCGTHCKRWRSCRACACVVCKKCVIVLPLPLEVTRVTTDTSKHTGHPMDRAAYCKGCFSASRLSNPTLLHKAADTPFSNPADLDTRRTSSSTQGSPQQILTLPLVGVEQVSLPPASPLSDITLLLESCRGPNGQIIVDQALMQFAANGELPALSTGLAGGEGIDPSMLASLEYQRQLVAQIQRSLAAHMVFPSSFYPPTAPRTTTQAVAALALDQQAKSWARECGLDIMNITWEDSARFQNSAYGPCISDMTLVVDQTRMPVVRAPNVSDPIMSVSTSQITVTVGNESSHDVPLTKISLQEYLANIHKYTELEESLCAPSHDCTQACFLPIEESASKTDFHVGLYNYQSTPEDPAVLILACTDAGTSAQVVSHTNRVLNFNQRGAKHTFVAERLSIDRAKRGVTTTGAMTTAEEARNYVMIVQIPLERRLAVSNYPGFTCMAPMQQSQILMLASGPQSHSPNVEAAMVGLGDAQGPFPKLSKFSHVKRNALYPIRVTVQFYQATSNGVVSREILQDLATKMDAVKTNASWWGSLVTPDSPSWPSGLNPHEGIWCDDCSTLITTPERYKCLCCPNYDACATCVARGVRHPGIHPLLRLTQPPAAYGFFNYAVQNRNGIRHCVQCLSCHQQIVGILYRCTVCAYYYLCEACELTEGHANFQHPLTKIFTSTAA
ncbi:CUE domain containing protein [Achlya hypogyna]|uniref:CUE domain containing protein n=1 Tax=Achlya hypogyna TaxID=1202772 RepID=A0A1V9YP95_ACHHY|nr:CUE domain containing protein [Achlya hypogyna]